MEGKTIDGKTNHYLASAEQLSASEIAFSYLDVSTGEARAELIEGSEKQLIAQLQSLNIRECIVTEQLFLVLGWIQRYRRKCAPYHYGS